MRAGRSRHRLRTDLHRAGGRLVAAGIERTVVPGSVRTDSVGVWGYAEAHDENGECGCLDII